MKFFFEMFGSTNMFHMYMHAIFLPLIRPLWLQLKLIFIQIFLNNSKDALKNVYIFFFCIFSPKTCFSNSFNTGLFNKIPKPGWTIYNIHHWNSWEYAQVKHNGLDFLLKSHLKSFCFKGLKITGIFFWEAMILRKGFHICTNLPDCI